MAPPGEEGVPALQEGRPQGEGLRAQEGGWPSPLACSLLPSAPLRTGGRGGGRGPAPLQMEHLGSRVLDPLLSAV